MNDIPPLHSFPEEPESRGRRKKKIYTPPNRIILSVSGLCNNKCLFCCASSDRSMRSLAQIKSELDAAREKDCDEVVLTGGEPTIYPDIIEVVSYAKSIGFKSIKTVTNGRMFFYRDFTDEIINAGLNEIIFSIHGPAPEVHDLHTGSPGSFSQLIKGIKNVSSHKNVIISTNTTITKMNYKYLPSTIQLMINLGIRSNVNIIGLWLFNRAIENRNRVMPDYSEVRPYLAEAIQLCVKNNVSFFIVRFPPEYMEGYETYIPVYHLLPHDISPFNIHFRDAPQVDCKGIGCTYCELKAYCPSLAEILGKINQRQKPSVFKINIGASCSNNCSFCTSASKEKAKSGISEIKNQLRLAKYYGAGKLEFTDGESITPARLIDIVKLAKKGNFDEISIRTSGKGLTPRNVEKLKEAGVSRLVICLHGSKAEIHDGITRIEGSFREARRAILASKGIIPVETNTVITSTNYSDLPSLAAMLNETGVSTANFLLLNPSSLIKQNPGNGPIKYYDDPPLTVSIRKIAPYLEKSSAILGERLKVRDVPKCIFSNSINHPRDFILESYLLSEIFEKQFVNLALKYIKKAKLKRLACKSCIFSEECDGLYYENVRLYGFSELTPILKEQS